MLEVNIDASEVTRLAKLLEQSPAVIEAAKKDAIAAAAPKMKAIVDQAIGGSGKVRSWQGQYVGSKGLYAAVRPRKETYVTTKGKYPARGGPKKYAVGYVTNAVNSGHKFPVPSGENQRYRPRIRSGQMRVPGKNFYQNAAERLGQVTQEAAESISHAIISHLSGSSTAATSPNAGRFQSFSSNIGGKVYTFRHI